MINAAEFVAAAKRRGAAGTVLPFAVDVCTAVALVGQLQLALRHPANTGDMALVIEGFTRGLIDQIATGPDAATLRAGLMLGFDPAQDQEPKGPDRRAWLRKWYRAMPESWRAGLWQAVGGAAWLGELSTATPPGKANGEGVGVLFLPLPLARVLAAALERGDFPGV